MDDQPTPVAVIDPHTGLGGAELAEHHGMAVSGARPSLRAYSKVLWTRRHFIASFSSAKTAAVYTTARLGQVWQVLTPILNAGVYFVIFGILLHQNRGIPHFIAFLTTGVFLYNFTQQTVQTSTRAIADNLNLIRALHFPRACLPLANMMTQLQQMLISTVVMLIIVEASGQALTLQAFMLVPILLLMSVFNGGLSLIFARIGAKNTDLAQVMPFVMRIWMYLSGVMFNIHQLSGIPKWAQTILEINPMAIFIDLARQALHVLPAVTVHGVEKIPYEPIPLPHHVWLMALGWTIAVGIGGYVWFWRSEEEYGRG